MNVPGIADLEAVARGRTAPDRLAAQLKLALLSEDPQTVVRACDVLWMGVAYDRRSRFERTHFAEVPSYQVAPHFALPLSITASDCDGVATRLEMWMSRSHVERDVAHRALTGLNAAIDSLGAATPSSAVRRIRELERDWYPGSNYSEVPMRADDVATFADERALVDRLGTKIQSTLSRVAVVTGCPRAHGNHAKATVLSATLEADPRARACWRELLGTERMSGGLRLSNSAPDLRTVDHKGNLIGFRFSFMTDRSREAFTTPNADGGWLTMTANSAPGAHVQTPERHIAFTDSVGSPHANLLETIQSVCTQSSGVLRNARNIYRTAREVVRAIPQGKAVSARPRLNDLVFHSRHAYRLGAQAIRYVVRVVDPVFPAPPDHYERDADFRHRAMVEMLKHTEVVATIGIQILPDFVGADAVAQTLYLIEDMRADWVGIPDEPFGIVRIPRQSVDPTAARDQMVRWFADNPVDLLAAGWMFAPLGAAGRSRTVVYAASQVARSASEPLGLPPRLRSR